MTQIRLGSDEVIELGRGPEGERALALARGALDSWIHVYSDEASRLVQRQSALALEGGEAAWEGWLREAGLGRAAATPLSGEAWEATRAQAAALLAEAQALAGSGIRAWSREGMRMLGMEIDRTIQAYERAAANSKPVRPALRSRVDALALRSTRSLALSRARLSAILGADAPANQYASPGGADVLGWLASNWGYIAAAAGAGLGVAAIVAIVKGRAA